MTEPNTIVRNMLSKYGNLMTASEVCSVLRFANVNSLRMAIRRKSIVLRPLEIEHKRTKLFATEEVAEILISWLQKPANQNGGANEEMKTPAA
ncbi:MAG: hypothetical protein KGM83_00540 [Betaproteobacteria bacterium]|nr:hypothetical protein [Betaproteobacteria bacterium]